MEKFFKVKEHGSTVKTEVLAGITTFMAMAYILMVNANMFSELGVVSYNAIYIATAISAVVGTFLIAFLANLPLGLASGMGLKHFLCTQSLYIRIILCKCTDSCIVRWCSIYHPDTDRCP